MRVGTLTVGDRADVREIDFLRLAQMVDQRAGRGSRGRMTIEAEAFEPAGAQLMQQCLARRAELERPGVDRRDRES